ncbi:MAG: indole-3-glycerol phosphate synthase TrpC [Microbacteriaceae bacterium]
MLEGLYAGSVADAAAREQQTPASKLEILITQRTAWIDAKSALAPRENIHILAEVKRASPSRGDLAEISDPVALAKTYANSGASAISVLTEERKFKGSLDDLRKVAEAVSVPVLRKDFIENEYQLLEAAAFGADIFLLIVAGLDQSTLSRLKSFGESLGMTAFVETHSETEVLRALELDAKLVGVNARDLSTFETDRELFGKLVHLFPADVIKVAESAVRNAADVKHYREAGADVALVGEALVTSDSSETLREFVTI